MGEEALDVSLMAQQREVSLNLADFVAVPPSWVRLRSWYQQAKDILLTCLDPHRSARVLGWIAL